AGGGAPPSWARRFAAGFGSGILNPKNALFYASLFALLAGERTSAGVQLAYGVWMFAAVLGWDLLVAAGIGHPAVMARGARDSVAVERGAGAGVLALAAGGRWLRAGSAMPAWLAPAAQ